MSKTYECSPQEAEYIIKNWVLSDKELSLALDCHPATIGHYRQTLYESGAVKEYAIRQREAHKIPHRESKIEQPDLDKALTDAQIVRLNANAHSSVAHLLQMSSAQRMDWLYKHTPPGIHPDPLPVGYYGSKKTSSSSGVKKKKEKYENKVHIEPWDGI